jgi:hypothetical protein
MKKSAYTILTAATMMFLASCEPQEQKIDPIGLAPSNGKITIDASDAFNPVFSASADRGFIYYWDFGNGQKLVGPRDASSYYPFPNTYTVTCNIYGEGGQGPVKAQTTFTVTTTDPDVVSKPIYKELTGGGTGRTWVYNTDPETGNPDYSYQTTNDLADYPDNWMPSASWGQCTRITPDINGEMVFDFNGGSINYTYHHVAGDEGIKGTFVVDAANKTLTIVDPYILDYAIDCTNPTATATGKFEIKLLTDDEMVLWQDQQDGVTGWGWSFKRKGYNP